MTQHKSVGQVLIETYAKNQRESYDRYMYRMYKEQRATQGKTLEERVTELERRLNAISSAALI